MSHEYAVRDQAPSIDVCKRSIESFSIELRDYDAMCSAFMLPNRSELAATTGKSIEEIDTLLYPAMKKRACNRPQQKVQKTNVKEKTMDSSFDIKLAIRRKAIPQPIPEGEEAAYLESSGYYSFLVMLEKLRGKEINCLEQYQKYTYDNKYFPTSPDHYSEWYGWEVFRDGPHIAKSRIEFSKEPEILIGSSVRLIK